LHAFGAFWDLLRQQKTRRVSPGGPVRKQQSKKSRPIYERGGHWMVVDSRPHIAQFRTFFAI